MTDIIVKKSGGDGSTKNLDDEFIEVNKRKQTVELGLDKMTEMKLSKYEEFRLLREQHPRRKGRNRNEFYEQVAELKKKYLSQPEEEHKSE